MVGGSSKINRNIYKQIYYITVPKCAIGMANHILGQVRDDYLEKNVENIGQFIYQMVDTIVIQINKTFTDKTQSFPKVK